MTLPRDRNEPGAATPDQHARGVRWAERRRRNRPRTDRDRWAAFDDEETRTEQHQISRGGNR